VMLSHYEDGKVHHRAVNACLCPLYAVEGMHVVTVEGEHLRQRKGCTKPHKSGAMTLLMPCGSSGSAMWPHVAPRAVI
jgi:xanthine dehydrogenase iron-sulfur cluster and FAD-binding subunit A